jgi:hypothetical protein
MQSIKEILETYLMVLIHPFRIHQQFRFSLPLPGHEDHLYQPLKLSESLAISWLFAIIRGIGKLVLMNVFLQSFLELQSEDYPLLQELVINSSLSTYYFLLFSSALDIIFFPIAALVMTEIWAWFIRLFSKWLNPSAPHELISDQVTTHALSSNLFTMIPFIGDVLQPLTYYFLLYAGLRSNLGASRSLAFIILATPTLLTLMLLSLGILALFYLVF